MIKDWKELEFWSSNFYKEFINFSNDNLSTYDSFYAPNLEDTFKAFSLCPLDKTKVLILGQDPYPTKGHANGLAFSVNKGVSPFPPSLRNIFQELVDDVGVPYPTHGDLSSWARQGVLLLNTSLTCAIDKPGSHVGLGWERLVEEVIKSLWSENIVYILWGKHAMDTYKNTQVVYPELSETDNAFVDLIISSHPSPLSADKGFFGSKPFSLCNILLEEMDKEPIDWRLE